MNSDPDRERIEKAVEALGEHFDAVQIFAVRTDTDGTLTYSKGCGNWFARYGQIRTWLVKQDEYTKKEVQKEEDDQG